MECKKTVSVWLERWRRSMSVENDDDLNEGESSGRKECPSWTD